MGRPERWPFLLRESHPSLRSRPFQQAPREHTRLYESYWWPYAYRHHVVLVIDLPFLWPVHMGEHDYTRYTLCGLQLLCRRFDEVRAGISGGPGQTLALSIYQLFRTFSYARLWSAFLVVVLPWFIFWLRYLDCFLNRLPQASDGACGVFFIGRKRATALNDRDILRRYWRLSQPKRHPRIEERIFGDARTTRNVR